MANSHPPRLCIFCQKTPISKEHIRAKWMREFLTPSQSTSHEVNFVEVQADGKIQRKEGKGALNLNGDHRSRALKVVCINCNGSWMSKIQILAKPILMPLIKGEWSYLSAEQQGTLSAWCAMFTMVYEHAHPETVTIPYEERRRFRIETTRLLRQKRAIRAPDGWLVYAGLNSIYSDATLHRSLVVEAQDYLGQVTISCFARFITIACSSTRHGPSEAVLDRMSKCASDDGFIRLAPSNELNVFQQKAPAKTIIHKETITALMNRLTS